MNLLWPSVVRQWLTGFLALAAVLLVAPPAVVAGFSDVESHWSREFVAPLAARGIVNAYPDGAFHPDRPMSRAEFVKMMVLAVGDPVPAPVLAQLPPVFSDVDPWHWSRAYVEAAWERGWLTTGSGEPFGPDQFITRAEVALIAARAGGLTEPPRSQARFADAEAIPTWARQAAAAVVAEGWMTGYPDGSFRPGGILTRAEAAAVTARMLRSRGALYDAVGYLTAEPRRTGELVELKLRLDSGEDAAIRLPAGATAWRNGRSMAVSQLRFLDEVALIASGPGEPYVEAWYSDEGGRFVAAPPSLQRITYRNDQGQRRSRAIAAGALISRNGRPAELTDLQPDDLVYLVLARDGAVRAIDAVRVDVRGRIWTADLTWDRLAIGATSGSTRWYSGADEVIVFIDGRRAAFGDLRVGDRLLAAVDPSGRLQYVEAYRREAPAR